MGESDLSMGMVIDRLAALEGKNITVEVHATGSGPAPRAMLTGRAGRIGMAQESEGSEGRGLVSLPIGAEPGRGAIYFGENDFSWAQDDALGRLTIALRDQTFYVVDEREG